ncbi:hypothetical protein BDF19DRAFT_454521, partial [Syncephalis fuscata]
MNFKVGLFGLLAALLVDTVKARPVAFSDSVAVGYMMGENGQRRTENIKDIFDLGAKSVARNGQLNGVVSVDDVIKPISSGSNQGSFSNNDPFYTTGVNAIQGMPPRYIGNPFVNMGYTVIPLGAVPRREVVVSRSDLLARAGCIPNDPSCTVVI